MDWWLLYHLAVFFLASFLMVRILHAKTGPTRMRIENREILLITVLALAILLPASYFNATNHQTTLFFLIQLLLALVLAALVITPRSLAITSNALRLEYFFPVPTKQIPFGEIRSVTVDFQDPSLQSFFSPGNTVEIELHNRQQLRARFHPSEGKKIVGLLREKLGKEPRQKEHKIGCYRKAGKTTFQLEKK